jgi:hypothetical protein
MKIKYKQQNGESLSIFIDTQDEWSRDRIILEEDQRSLWIVDCKGTLSLRIFKTNKPIFIGMKYNSRVWLFCKNVYLITVV